MNCNYRSVYKVINVVLDVFFVLCILCLLNKTLIQPMPEQSHLLTHYEMLRFGWMASPVLLIYFALRTLRGSAIFSSYLTLSLILLFNHVNIEKLALTGTPISFNDIISIENLSVIIKYITLNNTLLFFTFIIISVFCFFIGKKIPTTKKHHISLTLVMLMAIPLAFSPYASGIFGGNSSITQKVNLLTQKYKVNYISWDWDSNAKVNGLPMHLVQTSARKMIPSVSEKERDMYSKNTAVNISKLQSAKTIVYILCESCWYDSNNFKKEFKPLVNIGLRAFRAVSPAYGGGTANVEFEMLTGLPSNSGVLSGVIYQEYSAMIKNNADTLPSNLRNQGFLSVAAHNYTRGFWHRDVVYQKFGFDKFIALDDMGELPSEYAVQRKSWQWQPDDFLLYRSVLNEIRKNKDKPHFFNLVTMSTHGPEKFENDFGEHSYTFKVRESISRMVEFIGELEKLDPNALIVVYGDHKPGMNRYFFENKIFSAEFYIKRGEKDTDFIFNNTAKMDKIGDVPVFIKGGNDEAISKFIAEANGKPLFCVSAIVDRHFIHSGLFAFNYNIHHGCLDEKRHDYEEVKKITPPWIYSLSLFK